MHWSNNNDKYLYCWHPMTWWSSKWKMWVYYDYYWCNRKECENKENVSTSKLHKEYILWKETEQMKWQIEKMDAEISWISNKIWKIENPEIIKSLEKD
jgi:hypothetical protein